MFIAIDKILPNPEQPRTVFDAEELESLAASIREHGVIEPLVVEEAEDGMYILHDGERRLRASRMAGLQEVPAYVQPTMITGVGRRDRLLRALVANVQRSDMNGIEEGAGYAKLVEMGLSIDEVARKMGKSRARISARMEWLKLEQPIQELVAEGRIHRDVRLARGLLEIQDVEARVTLANRLARSERGIRLSSAILACTNLKMILEKNSQVVKLDTGEPPALQMARRRGPNEAHWDALRQAGKRRNALDLVAVRIAQLEHDEEGAERRQHIDEQIGQHALHPLLRPGGEADQEAVRLIPSQWRRVA